MSAALAAAAAHASAIARATRGGACARARARTRWEETVAKAEQALEPTLATTPVPLLEGAGTMSRLTAHTAGHLWTGASMRMEGTDVEHETLRRALAALHGQAGVAVRLHPRAQALARAGAACAVHIGHAHGERARGWRARASALEALARVGPERWRRAGAGPAWVVGYAIARWGADRLEIAAATLVGEERGEGTDARDERRLARVLEAWRFDRARPPFACALACARAGIAPQGDGQWSRAVEAGERPGAGWNTPSAVRATLAQAKAHAIGDVEAALGRSARRSWKGLGGDAEGFEALERGWREDPVLEAGRDAGVHLGEDAARERVCWRAPYSGVARVLAGAGDARDTSSVAREVHAHACARYEVSARTRERARAQGAEKRTDEEGMRRAEALKRLLDEALGREAR